MNTLLINDTATRLRNMANTPNILAMPIDAAMAVGISKDISIIAESVIQDEPRMHRILSTASGNLFASNRFGQALINPFAPGKSSPRSTTYRPAIRAMADAMAETISCGRVFTPL